MIMTDKGTDKMNFMETDCVDMNWSVVAQCTVKLMVPLQGV
jgi:hypothetical protein